MRMNIAKEGQVDLLRLQMTAPEKKTSPRRSLAGSTRPEWNREVTSGRSKWKCVMNTKSWKTLSF